jgi:hypothetical protein
MLLESGRDIQSLDLICTYISPVLVDPFRPPVADETNLKDPQESTGK